MNKPGGDRRSQMFQKEKYEQSSGPELEHIERPYRSIRAFATSKGTGVYESKLTTYSREEEERLLKNQEELKVLFENIDIEKRKEKNETEA